MLAYQGFEFIFKRGNRNGDCVWRCRNYATKPMPCSVTMKLKNGIIIDEPGMHNHDSDLVGAAVKQVREYLKDTAIGLADVATSEVVDCALQSLPTEVQLHMPKRKSLSQLVNRQRKGDSAFHVPEPDTRNFDFPLEYQDLIWFDSGKNDEDRIVFLGNKDMISQLMCSHWIFNDMFVSSLSCCFD